LDVIRSSTSDTQDRYVNDAFSASYPYEKTSTAISAKVGYALDERTVVSGIIKSTSWDEDDDGDKSDGSDTALGLGATYQVNDQLLLAGAVENAKSTENGASDSAINVRAGAEYTLSDSIKLRGGLIHLGGDTTVTDFTAGAGLAVGPGTLDVYAMFGSSSSDIKYSQIHAAYTFNF
jgi:predicted porin